MAPRKGAPAASAAKPRGPEADRHLTRDEACEVLNITPEAFARIERGGPLEPDASGRFEPLAVARAAVNYAWTKAETSETTLKAVGESLSQVQPALERLAKLADHAGLSGDEHHRTMVEVAAFFTAFADVMNRATAALKAGESE